MTTATFRRRALTSADWMQPPASEDPAPIPGIVRSPSGYEHPDRRRPEAAALRRLMDDEQDLSKRFLFGSRAERSEAAVGLREARNGILLERLQLEGRS
jgi:hypothetical protein